MAGMYGCFRGRNSDSAAMASEPSDVMTNQEPAEVQEECSGKKKSKFQTFKKFFARKKRKDPSATGADGGLKASQSSDNVSKASENNTLTRSEKDKGSGSKISLGSKALSHDSVFVSDSSEANEALGASQDSIHGKVKSLQLQLKQAIRLGSPPSLMCVKKTEDVGTMSEDDGLPCSPPEYTTLHTVMNQAQRNSSISLEGMDSDDDQLYCAASSRAVSPLVVPADFSQPASPFGCLDNSAAKHKLGLRHKACNKRKPASRLEGRAEGASMVEEMLTNSIPEAETDAAEEQKQQRTEDVCDDQLKPKVESREEEEEGEEKEQPQHSRQSLLRDKEQKEEPEDESEAEQDVSHSLDTSCPPEPSLSDVEGSSKHSSRASSPDSPGATPEPPAGPREYLLDPPGIAYGAEENRVERDLASGGEEDEEQEKQEEESSLLEEVLSSLKTPLVSHSLDVEAEGIVLQIKEEKGDVESGEEVESDDQAVLSCAIMSGQTAVEEEEVAPSCEVEEEVKSSDGEEEEEEEEEEDEDKAEDEDEELVVERFIQESPDEEEQEEDVKPEEENDNFTRQTVGHAGEEEEREEEEEAIELEKEPEVDEEEQEKREEEDEDGIEEDEEAMEEEKSSADELMEIVSDVRSDTPLQEADEGVELEADHTKHMSDDEIPEEMGDQVMQAGNETSGDEREDEEERAEEEKSDQEEDIEVNQTDTDPTEEELEQESTTITPDLHIETDPSEATEQAAVSFPKPCSLSLSESPPESHPQHSEPSTPSKTSTTSIHINLVSPSSEKASASFQLPPTAAEAGDSVSESPSPDEEPHAASTIHEERAVEETPSTQEQEAATPTSVQETVNQPPSTVDQSKPRFTIAPAWQRSQSLTPPSSPPACVPSSSEPKSEEVEEVTKKDAVMNAEPVSPAKVDLVLSPSRGRNIAAKPQSNTAPVKAQTSAEVEGNHDNPFGVRLRKTSALFRFNSEEENTEPSVESPPQPTSCKVDSPQPLSVKPSVCPPVSIKPALPKKPEVHGESGGKPKWISDPAAGHGASAGSDCPSWISVAKQKQKIYKENSLDDITVKKEEQERKSSLPMYVSSAASRELSCKTAEASSKAAHLEITKPSASVEKDARRSLSPPTPVPPQPSKSQPLPCPVAPKPQAPPVAAKHPLQPTPPQRSLSPPTPVPVPQKSPSCTSPPSLSKNDSSPPVTSPPFSSRGAPEKSAQRGVPPPALPQDEPPWMALAKKKAKAWSEMPQIVQ